jgi:hypothetical protein
MRVDPRDHDFIATRLPTVQGWLHDESAYLTSTLLRAQSQGGVTGSIFEIGVFAGKYLSLLYHVSSDANDRVLGLDTFEWYAKKKVEANFNEIFGGVNRLTLVTLDSTQASAGDLHAALGTPPRFISVDGAHTAPAVLHDLELSESLLTPGGIVAIDDFLNPRAIGVGEGAYRYFLKFGENGLVPFAYCANKLFAARNDDAARWRAKCWTFAESNPSLSMSVEFDKLSKQGRNWVEQDLLGQSVLIF